MRCSHCKDKLNIIFVDLGSMPLSNAYLAPVDLVKPEKIYPLRVMVCEKCWLVQTEKFIEADQIFSRDYTYFSSFSTSWLNHVRKYIDQVVPMLALNSSSSIVEIGANDGYLLQYVQEKNIPCYGVEPAHAARLLAQERGLNVVGGFFGAEKAEELIDKKGQADLIIANNVLAHVPDINDFVKGFSILLKPNGVATFEFPHILNLVHLDQFDTIYREHYSYLSLVATCNVFEPNNLAIFRVEELPTHGGSLRVYAQRMDSGKHPLDPSVGVLMKKEINIGIMTTSFYSGFEDRVSIIRSTVNSFLQSAKKEGKKIVGYGAAAKGNTFLNFCGINSNLISYVIDHNPAKQNKFLPGSRIPILSEDRLRLDQPDYVLIFPWNIKQEIIEQLSYIRAWNGKFLTFVPELMVE